MLGTASTFTCSSLILDANGDLLAGPSHAEEEPIKTGVKRAKKRSAPSDDEESDQDEK